MFAFFLFLFSIGFIHTPIGDARCDVTARGNEPSLEPSDCLKSSIGYSKLELMDNCYETSREDTVHGEVFVFGVSSV